MNTTKRVFSVNLGNSIIEYSCLSEIRVKNCIGFANDHKFWNSLAFESPCNVTNQKINFVFPEKKVNAQNVHILKIPPIHTF